METTTRLAQEGTFVSDRDTGVTLEVHDAPQCTAVNDILARVGDKWSVRVVMALTEESRRFNELRREIPGISQRMLTRTLRGLERDGLVSRAVTPTVPPRVDYALTALGKSLCNPVAQLGNWAIANIGKVEAARAVFDSEQD
ncbi:MAG: transcriptional regulator [Citromicrobium sp.]|jgi:DNA-binding HxlR family transcriptional regulator|uniref:winged helix-turn-helix transcriptional regulator n=1 Tax=Qipengyuania pacifica TaxID=2860199 RepID=UPI000C0F01F9|nr:transcriptional regulator [Sphingomonadaceae bacterium]MBV02050.1 transcriptional regulator [Citromicrobium sp.]MBY8333468.1 helix-turn-helix transcriptional regulator [Qipengyuania pacifica]MCH2495930.1 helix-turn-helix transcriptional regulator [Erythrobacter sp.]QPL39223.1 helix-turn-helix transcriptional regulator [Erythrobacter sp. A30-3]|tara:strand:- start:482 stop:907 length:426 start_codon:yes stop_codon:yes gene_type:complete